MEDEQPTDAEIEKFLRIFPEGSPQFSAVKASWGWPEDMDGGGYCMFTSAVFTHPNIVIPPPADKNDGSYVGQKNAFELAKQLARKSVQTLRIVTLPSQFSTLINLCKRKDNMQEMYELKYKELVKQIINTIGETPDESSALFSEELHSYDEIIDMLFGAESAWIEFPHGQPNHVFPGHVLGLRQGQDEKVCVWDSMKDELDEIYSEKSPDQLMQTLTEYLLRPEVDKFFFSFVYLFNPTV